MVEMAAHLEGAADALRQSVAAVRRAATEELKRREDRWRPLGRALAAWLPSARLAEEERARLPRMKAAEAWLKGAHQQLREQRFAPIADQVQAHWQDLRQSSSVQLGQLRLEGTGTSTQRRLSLDVSIDGEPGSALGVMSQGELNCLAPSLFLPRARMGESPFRFIVIDDPVQAMDPVKVEGLARVLDNVAKDRQVVVLTHDDRLPEAVRRLDMDATIIEVTRRELSMVELRTALDPVRRYIEDARAVALSNNLPPETHHVVAGLRPRLASPAPVSLLVSHRKANPTGDRHPEELIDELRRRQLGAAKCCWETGHGSAEAGGQGVQSVCRQAQELLVSGATAPHPSEGEADRSIPGKHRLRSDRVERLGRSRVAEAHVDLPATDGACSYRSIGESIESRREIPQLCTAKLCDRGSGVREAPAQVLPPALQCLVGPLLVGAAKVTTAPSPEPGDDRRALFRVSQVCAGPRGTLQLPQRRVETGEDAVVAQHPGDLLPGPVAAQVA